MVDRESIMEATRECLSEWCDLEDDAWRLVAGDVTSHVGHSSGPDLAKKWSLLFNGAYQLAIRRASKEFSMLRHNDGSWHRLYADTPLGRSVQLFISRDKNPKTLATASLAKKLYSAVDEYFFRSPAARGSYIHCLKWQGVIALNGQHLCKVQTDEPGQHVVLWNNDLVAQRNVCKQSILARFQELAASRRDGGTQWAV